MKRLIRIVALYGVLVPGLVVAIAVGVAAYQEFPPGNVALALAFAFACVSLVLTSGADDHIENAKAMGRNPMTAWRDLHEHDEWNRTSPRIVAIRAFFIGGFVIAGATLAAIHVA
ncbi:hypothetical protein U3A55_08535 [Salarchaeum sp. III]|uniref:hypothetical protein n=1 Tax=Salarchaeum sp. III TaxID=3107927 RepID=UPI002ED8A2EE